MRSTRNLKAAIPIFFCVLHYFKIMPHSGHSYFISPCTMLFYSELLTMVAHEQAKGTLRLLTPNACSRTEAALQEEEQLTTSYMCNKNIYILVEKKKNSNFGLIFKITSHMSQNSLKLKTFRKLYM